MPPRGGRGGGRGGKSGGGPPNAQWDYDPEFQPDYKPTELFPPVDQYAPSYMTRRERLQVARYRTFRDRVHEGPLYTVLSETKHAGRLADPFEGMPTYTQKYQKRTRRLPKLDTRPYVLEFFPRELWSTLDPDHDKNRDLPPDGVSANKRQKKLTFARDDAAKLLREAEAVRAEMAEKRDGDVAAGDDAAAAARNDDVKDDLDAENDGNDNDDDNEGAAPEEEVDDEFEEDEDDAGDDYNAQQHYEDADYDDDDGGGGGDEDFGQME
ncbi:MAG: hypothetical protein M1823_004297 [Watsoniomyces obsoletus]|nr:MAG: hypothetical protein M1823_004297 [Watsoniomyces obsoletus]